MIPMKRLSGEGTRATLTAGSEQPCLAIFSRYQDLYWQGAKRRPLQPRGHPCFYMPHMAAVIALVALLLSLPAKLPVSRRDREKMAHINCGLKAMGSRKDKKKRIQAGSSLGILGIHETPYVALPYTDHRVNQLQGCPEYCYVMKTRL